MENYVKMAYLTICEMLQKLQHCSQVNFSFIIMIKCAPELGIEYQLCAGASIGVLLLIAEPSLSIALGIITDLQHIRANSNSIINKTMQIHMNMVFFQYHIILFKRGSSDSSTMDASYISGIPAPGLYSALCPIITFKQEVGTSRSVKPFIFNARVWDSDMQPATRGAALRKVNKKRIGSLLNFKMDGWLLLARVFPSAERKSARICK